MASIGMVCAYVAAQGRRQALVQNYTGYSEDTCVAPPKSQCGALTLSYHKSHTLLPCQVGCHGSVSTTIMFSALVSI